MTGNWPIRDQAAADWEKALGPFNRWMSRWAWIPLVLFFGAFIWGDLSAGWQNEDAALREAHAMATIIEDHTNNHGQFLYVFVVRGTSYSALGSLPDRKLKIGEQVVAYYDRDNPKTSALEHLSEVSEKRIGSTTAGATIFGLLIAFALWRSGVWRRDGQTSAN